jgi:predicted XRE-type DNA-binding protein
MTKPQTFANVWDALEDTPEDAAAMTVRSDILSEINDAVRAWKMPQREAASRLGVTQPRLNDLLQGKISKFSLEALLTLAGRAGLDVRFTVRPAAIAARPAPARSARATLRKAAKPPAVPARQAAAVKPAAKRTREG